MQNDTNDYDTDSQATETWAPTSLAVEFTEVWLSKYHLQGSTVIGEGPSTQGKHLIWEGWNLQ